MLGYEYHPAAEAEYLEAVGYYSRISAELGILFVTEVEAAIERARRLPQAYPKTGLNLRRILTHRFRHAVIYEALPDRIFI